MKIVYLTSNSRQGGAQKHLRDMFRALVELGHDLYLIAPEGWLVEELGATPDHLFVLELHWGTTSRVAEILEQIQPDIVHTFLLRGGVNGCLAWKRSQYGRLYVTVNNPVIYEGIKHLNRFLYPCFYRWLARSGAVFLAKSEQLRDEVRRVVGNQVPTLAIKNGVDFALFDRYRKYPDLRAQWHIPHEALVIASVGALEMRKGHCYLLEVVARLAAEHPNIYCCLVGSGSEEANLRVQNERLGIGDQVRLLGSRHDINAVLANADVFALPSLHEGLPNALLEAMAMGLPCVASEVGGVRELLAEPGMGSVVPPGSAEALYQELGRYLADSALRRATGERAYSKVKDEYDQSAVLAQLLSIYRQYSPGGDRE